MKIVTTKAVSPMMGNMKNGMGLVPPKYPTAIAAAVQTQRMMIASFAFIVVRLLRMTWMAGDGQSSSKIARGDA